MGVDDAPSVGRVVGRLVVPHSLGEESEVAAVGSDGGNLLVAVLVGEVEEKQTAVRAPVREPGHLVTNRRGVAPVDVGRPQERVGVVGRPSRERDPIVFCGLGQVRPGRGGCGRARLLRRRFCRRCACRERDDRHRYGPDQGARPFRGEHHPHLLFAGHHRTSIVRQSPVALLPDRQRLPYEHREVSIDAHRLDV